MDTGLGPDTTNTPVEAPPSSSGKKPKRKPCAHPFPITRRRRREGEPFLFVIVDHDNRRYTIEGPMTDAEGWTTEIIAARRSGRRITCRVVTGSVEDAVKICKKTRAGKRWPSGAIVAPPGMLLPDPTPANSDEGYHNIAIEATSPMVLQLLCILHRSNCFKIEAVGENQFRLINMPPSALAARRSAAP
jgi:hypothetical protein